MSVEGGQLPESKEKVKLVFKIERVARKRPKLDDGFETPLPLYEEGPIEEEKDWDFALQR